MLRHHICDCCSVHLCVCDIAHLLSHFALCTSYVLEYSAGAQVDDQGQMTRISGQQQKGSPTLSSADTGKLPGVKLPHSVPLSPRMSSQSFIPLCTHFLQQVCARQCQADILFCRPVLVKLIQTQCLSTQCCSCLILHILPLMMQLLLGLQMGREVTLEVRPARRSLRLNSPRPRALVPISQMCVQCQ